MRAVVSLSYGVRPHPFQQSPGGAYPGGSHQRCPRRCPRRVPECGSCGRHSRGCGVAGAWLLPTLGRGGGRGWLLLQGEGGSGISGAAMSQSVLSPQHRVGNPPFPGEPRGSAGAHPHQGWGGHACPSPGRSWHCPRYCWTATTPRGGAFGTRHRELSQSRWSHRPKGRSGDPVTPRCPPVPAARGAGAVCHRGSPSTAPGTGWRRSPWDKAAATRCPGEPRQPAERTRDESPSGARRGGAGGAGRGPSIQLRWCQGGHCWGKARGTGNPTGFTKDWICQQHGWTVHRAQMERGGDAVWVQGHPQACSGTSPQARTVPPTWRGVLTS